MEYPILISTINDYIFCPISIYFHSQYDEMNRILFQERRQVNGSAAHQKVDDKEYSTRKDVLQAKDVYCDRYGIIGKIDIFDIKNGILTERKKHIMQIYDGYIFQLYAQYFALSEMGYNVQSLRLYSFDDNKTYPVKLPNEDLHMFQKFENTLESMRNFNVFDYYPKDSAKCRNCIYRHICDRSLYYD